MRAVVLFVAKLWELTKMTRIRPSKCDGSDMENKGCVGCNLKQKWFHKKTNNLLVHGTSANLDACKLISHRIMSDGPPASKK